MSIQRVRKWCQLFDEGRKEVTNLAHSGTPSVVTDDLVLCIDERICEDRRVTFDDLEFDFQTISRGTFYSIVHDRLQYRKL